ncbi:MAG: hypothetical protein ACLR39_02645 [Oscillospiraceae bacterium]
MTEGCHEADLSWSRRPVRRGAESAGFFPEERPVYEPAEDGEDHALVTLAAPRYNTAVTTITYHGRTAVASPGPPWTRS